MEGGFPKSAARRSSEASPAVWAFKPDGLVSCSPGVPSEASTLLGPRITPDFRSITNLVEVPCKRSTLWAEYPLRHASDGTPVGSAIGIEQRTLFPRRGRCASTPGLHGGTPSGSRGSSGLDGSIGITSLTGALAYLGLRLRPRRSGALPGGQAARWRQQSGHLAPPR